MSLNLKDAFETQFTFKGFRNKINNSNLAYDELGNITDMYIYGSFLLKVGDTIYFNDNMECFNFFSGLEHILISSLLHRKSASASLYGADVNITLIPLEPELNYGIIQKGPLNIESYKHKINLLQFSHQVGQAYQNFKSEFYRLNENLKEKVFLSDIHPGRCLFHGNRY